MRTRQAVLINDDEEEDLSLVASAAGASRFSLSFILFRSADEALVYLTQSITIPAIIICDINMPRMDNLQFRSGLLLSASCSVQALFYFLTEAGAEPGRRIFLNKIDQAVKNLLGSVNTSNRHLCPNQNIQKDQAHLNY